jgi:hypothetical protein
MELTQEDRNILAHVILDTDAWVAHSLSTVGESAVTAKIERWRTEYLAQKDLPGYMSRAERDAAEAANKPDLSAQENYKSMIRRRARRLAAGSIDEKYQAILLLKKIGE